MKILGIDPGSKIIGYGLIKKQEDSIIPLNYGVIKVKDDERPLLELYSKFNELIDELKPDIVAIESLFFFKNAKTIINVSQSRGVLMLVIESKNIPCYQYTPLQIKQAIFGYGRAEKKDIGMMVQHIFELDKIPKPDDAADGLAAAYCAYVSLFSQDQLIS